MNWEYIPRHCLDQQFRSKKQFHLYDADIDITKLSVQSPLKYLITEISENKNSLALYLCHADHNSKSLHFKSNKK